MSTAVIRRSVTRFAAAVAAAGAVAGIGLAVGQPAAAAQPRADVHVTVVAPVVGTVAVVVPGTPIDDGVAGWD